MNSLLALFIRHLTFMLSIIDISIMYIYISLSLCLCHTVKGEFDLAAGLSHFTGDDSGDQSLATLLGLPGSSAGSGSEEEEASGIKPRTWDEDSDDDPDTENKDSPSADSEGSEEEEEEEREEEGEEYSGNFEDVPLPGEEEEEGPEYAEVQSHKVQQLFQSGCTIQALHPQQYSDPMWLLNSSLESMFGSLVGSNCYITPPNSQGLAPHHDDVEVFVLQLQGSKTWLLYPPVDPLAPSCSGDLPRSILGEPTELTLHPGDLLYFPRGTVHEARTGSSSSAHMTISTYQGNTWADFAKVAVLNALKCPINLRSYQSSMEIKSTHRVSGLYRQRELRCRE